MFIKECVLACMALSFTPLFSADIILRNKTNPALGMDFVSGEEFELDITNGTVGQAVTAYKLKIV